MGPRRSGDPTPPRDAGPAASSHRPLKRAAHSHIPFLDEMRTLPLPCLRVCWGWGAVQTWVSTSIVTLTRRGTLERGHRLSGPQLAHL